MNFQSLINKLEKSTNFKTFKSKNKDAQLVAGFFIFDFKDKREEATLDYQVGKEKEQEIATFNMQDINFAFKKEKILDKTKSLSPLFKEIKLQPTELKAMIQIQLKEHKIKNKLEKVIAVLSQDKKLNEPVWNLTIMCDGFVILLARMSAISEKVLKFEKKNLFNFIKPMPKK